MPTRYGMGSLQRMNRRLSKKEEHVFGLINWMPGRIWVEAEIGAWGGILPWNASG